jgi:hypothetical protein
MKSWEGCSKEWRGSAKVWSGDIEGDATFLSLYLPLPS